MSDPTAPLPSAAPPPADPAPAMAWLAAHGARLGFWIDGAWTVWEQGLAVTSPATGAELAQVGRATARDVLAAVTTAKAAQPSWAGLTPVARAEHLVALADALTRDAARLSLLETLQSGRPLRATTGRDLPVAADHLRHAAYLAGDLDRVAPDGAPVGVAAIILPWQSPLVTAAALLGPVLAAGNAAVVLAHPWAPLTALLLAELSRAAGLPDGVLNVITGDAAAGAALAADAEIGLVAGDAAPEEAQRLAFAALSRGAATLLSAPARTPVIVCDGADLDSAAAGVAEAAWSGQVDPGCAGVRILVQEGATPALLGRVEAQLQRVRTGDPLAPDTDQGSLAHAHLAAPLEALLKTTHGRVVRGPAPQAAAAAMVSPALVTGLAPADALMQAALHGPVVPVTTWRRPAEAVQLANATPTGRAAALWTERLTEGLAMAPRLAAGTVWLNGHSWSDPAMPWAGWRAAGRGGLGGAAALRAMTAVARPKTADAGPAPDHPEVGPDAIASQMAAATAAQTAWAARQAADRAAILSAVATAWSGDLEAAALLRQAAAWAAQGRGAVATASVDGGEAQVLIRDAPRGVLAVMAGGASPRDLVATLAVAWAAGNAVVLCGEGAAALYDEAKTAGLPEGLCGHVPDGAAKALAGHPGIDGIWRYDSKPTGWAAAAARTLTPVWDMDAATARDPQRLHDAATRPQAVWVPVAL